MRQGQRAQRTSGAAAAAEMAGMEADADDMM